MVKQATNEIREIVFMWQMKTPKVSVCVITFNHEKYIRQCLQSIVDQDVNYEYEIIVGEDCSTDGTRAIVQEFQVKYPLLLKSILHKSNIGGCNNYRSVHFAARGEYIAHLDGDDFWHPGKLLSQIDFMDRNQNCSAVYTNAWAQTDSGKIIGTFSNGVKRLFDTPYLILKGNFLTSSSMMYRANFRSSVIPASGFFVDFLINIRLAKCGQLGFIDRNLVSYTYQSAMSIILNDTDKIRLLLWDALQEVDLPKDQQPIVEKAKFNFIAEAILFETLHGRFNKISKWVSLLSNGAKKDISMLMPRLFFSAVVVLCKNITNLFHILAGKIRGHRVLYRK
jgi:glycosyltransferase involved in cell wall biosynthesis